MSFLPSILAALIFTISLCCILLKRAAGSRQARPNLPPSPVQSPATARPNLPTGPVQSPSTGQPNLPPGPVRSPTTTRPNLPPGPQPVSIIGNLHQVTALPHRGLRALAQRHGPVMSLRLGQVPALVLSSPESARVVLKDHDLAFATRPRIQASDHLSYGSKGLAFSEYGPYWRNVRKLCTLSLLSAARIESFAALRRAEVGSLVAGIVEEADRVGSVDVTRRVGEAVADMAAKMIFGSGLDEERRYYLKGLVHESLELAGAFNLADYVPFLKPFDLQGLTKRMKKLRKALDEVLEKILRDHEQAAKNPPDSHRSSTRNDDFVDVLLTKMNQPMNPNDEHVHVLGRINVKAILLDMIVAAFDTSATSVEWALSELLRNPRAMRKLRAELDRVVGSGRMVQESDLGQLGYLDLVVKESFRLHPVAPLLVPRESMTETTVLGFRVPEKTRVIINTWAIGRDPNVWSENVEEFLPERFSGSGIDLRGQDFELLPFGSGRRGCPGMQLGLTTVRLILAQLVHCFDWEIPSGVEIDMSEKFGLSMGRANPLLAKPAFRLLGHVFS